MICTVKSSRRINDHFTHTIGTPVLKSLQDANNVKVVHIAQPPSWISKLPRVLFLLVAPFKLIFGAISLWYTLIFRLPYFPKAILVQVRLSLYLVSCSASLS